MMMDNPTPTPKPIPPAAPKKSFLGTLFNKETRFGRFMRAASRWTALVLSLFALGLLAGYFLLYRPTQQSLGQTQASYRQASQDLTAAQKKVEDLTATNTSLSNQVLTLNQAVDRASQHVQLLQLVKTLQIARLSISNQDPVAARQMLVNSRTALNNLAAAIDKYVPGTSKTMQARLDLILSEIDQNQKTAGADVDVLVNQLLDYEKSNY
jgi:peptidoglycan hydrolase CwlO-like protein